MCGPNITGGDIEYSPSACAHLGNRYSVSAHFDARCRGAINSHSIALPHAYAGECSESSVRVRIPVGISLICTEFRVSCPSADTVVIFSVVPTDVHQEHSCLILVKAPNWYAFVLKYEIGYGCSYR